MLGFEHAAQQRLRLLWAAAERAVREATPEMIAEMQRRAADATNSISLEEALMLPDEPAPGSTR